VSRIVESMLTMKLIEKLTSKRISWTAPWVKDAFEIANGEILHLLCVDM